MGEGLELSCNKLSEGRQGVAELLEVYLEGQLRREENLVFDSVALGARDGAVDIEPEVGLVPLLDGVNHLTLGLIE